LWPCIFQAQWKKNAWLAIKPESNFNVLGIFTNTFSLMKNEGRGKKFSVFNLSHNSSVYLRLSTHYESNVITASTTTTTIHFVLRVVSAEFQTSRSEARHWRTRRKQPLLGSYLYNLPSSAKDYLQYNKHWND